MGLIKKIIKAINKIILAKLIWIPKIRYINGKIKKYQILLKCIFNL